MLVASVCTLAGAGVGHLAGSVAAGGFIGALASIPVAMLVTYRVILRPFREESLKRDYSHLTPQVDDD